MEKSESIKNLSAALQLFQLKVEKIKKDSTNPFFKSKYASLSSIIEAISTPLQEADLSISQFPDQNGLTTILIHNKSGEYFQATYIMPVSKPNDPQAVGSAITYARRYALVSILMLNVDEDDDGNEASKAAPTFTDTTSDKPWLNKDTDAFATAKEMLKAGTVTVDKIKTKYKISKEVLTLLNS